jgi:hypothetical protein
LFPYRQSAWVTRQKIEIFLIFSQRGHNRSYRTARPSPFTPIMPSIMRFALLATAVLVSSAQQVRCSDATCPARTQSNHLDGTGAASQAAMRVPSPFEISSLMEPFTMHMEGGCARGARPPPTCQAELKQLPERLSFIMDGMMNGYVPSPPHVHVLRSHFFTVTSRPAPLPQPLRLLRGEPTVPLLSQTHTVNTDVNIESRSSLPVHHLVITSLAHEGNVPQ